MQRKTNKRIVGGRGAGCRQGGVLLEYVILLGCLVPVLLGAQAFFFDASGAGSGAALFNPAGDYRNNFGLFGQAYHDFYANVVTNVSQPVP